MIAGNLEVKVLKEGVHSGHASGIVPSSFQIIRQLLDRVDDSATGVVKIPELHREIPQHRLDQTKSCAEALGSQIYEVNLYIFNGNNQLYFQKGIFI